MTNLPNARLVPKAAADKRAVLKAHASDHAKTAGRAALSLGKGLSLIALCGVGLAAIAAGLGTKSRTHYDFDRLQNYRPIAIPKFDFKQYEDVFRRDLLEYRRPTLEQQLRLHHDLGDPTLSPSQRESGSP